MANGNLINGITLDGNFTLTKSSNTVLTLNTNNSFLNKNIVLTLNTQTANPSFDGGALNNKTATATFTNLTTSASNTSGIAIITSGAAGRDAVLYNEAVEGWVSKTDKTVASSAISTENWTGTTYYATGVTLTAGKSFSITVPNGNADPITFLFSVDASGNTTITGGE